MGWEQGLLGGFVARKGEVEQQNLRAAELASARESKVYEALLSSPDPEIQAMAASGLLESTQPRKKKGGLRGWLGEIDVSPTFQSLQSLIKTPVPQGDPGPGTLAHTEYPTIATPPPSLGNAPAGTPDQSLTEPGAAPPPNIPTATPTPQAARPQPRQIPATVGAPPPMGPRQVFASPYDTALNASTAKARGDVEGEVQGLIAAGFTDVQARQMVKQTYDRRAQGAGAQSIAGEVVGPDGRAVPAYGVFDRVSGGYSYPAGHPQAGQPIPGFRPRTTTGSRSFGQDRESIALELFNRPFSQLSQIEVTQVNQEERTRMGQEAETRGLGQGRARIATELASPIGPTAAATYNVSPTTTLAELTNTVGLRPEQHDRVYALSQVDVSLNEIERLLPKVFPAVGPGVGGAMKTALSLGMQKLAADGDLAALDAAIKGSLAQLAQLTGQPGSRLSDRDIAIAQDQIGNLTPSFFGGDTIITAKARLEIVRKLFDKAVGSIPTAAPPRAAQPGVTPSVTPPPSRSNQSGPPGFFVDADGNLVQQ